VGEDGADCGPRKDTRRPAEATLDGDGRTFAQIADDRMPQEEAPSTCADDRTTSSAEKIAFARRLTELRRVEWVVYAKRPFAGRDRTSVGFEKDGAALPPMIATPRVDTVASPQEQRPARRVL
jgi:hypothetical protein